MSSRNTKHSDNISPDKGRCISLCRYSMETGLPSPSPSVTLPGLRLPASASLPLASCWPRPQQLLPVSATGGGRRRCKKGAARPFQTPKGKSKPKNASRFAKRIFWASPVYGSAEGVTFQQDFTFSKGVKSAAKQRIGETRKKR